jgi:hypothetical protein
MLRAGLLEDVSGGESAVLRITEAGMAALGLSDAAETCGVAEAGAHEGKEGQPNGMGASQEEALADPPAAPLARTSLQDAATALLAAWDAGVERSALPVSVEALRAALIRGHARPTRACSAPRRPREGTKHQAVLSLLRPAEGATVAGIMDATGWAQHTVRGFLAGLKKKGHAVEVMERVRQVGPGSQGAKGSYSIYRVTTSGGEQG